MLVEHGRVPISGGKKSLIGCVDIRMDHVTRPIEILFNLQIFRFFYVSYISMIRMIENLKNIWKRSNLNI